MKVWRQQMVAVVDVGVNERGSTVPGAKANYIKCRGFVSLKNNEFRRCQDKHNAGGNLALVS